MPPKITKPLATCFVLMCQCTKNIHEFLLYTNYTTKLIQTVLGVVTSVWQNICQNLEIFPPKRRAGMDGPCSVKLYESDFHQCHMLIAVNTSCESYNMNNKFTISEQVLVISFFIILTSLKDTCCVKVETHCRFREEQKVVITDVVPKQQQQPQGSCSSPRLLTLHL